MKPEQFIREYGVEKAKEVVEGAPKYANVYDIDNKGYADTSEDNWGLSCNLIGLRSLCGLVGYLDRVTKLGGLLKAKAHLDYLISFGSEFAGVSKEEIKKLQVAIKYHESIYGGGDA
ncbi:hypothetical protein ACWY38_003732 [Acinetobacter baumannii]|uniref:hypothetical protein n=1 Tax=Acinetobacter baumannii TaxID=470 RepID=UPI00186479AA|nr:hypothetical protein [Acinetobacter baumannii]EIJ7450506.1 hypothetical protein [Acinetobacter baumannii]EKT8552760.1 hypothetical protein [Acinetobacter baumannii]EKT9210212.1 hypothetical protein [Acinetobacter baumannii]EKT9382991.1 hypothetical protein [Acinetobacter baumannii]